MRLFIVLEEVAAPPGGTVALTDDKAVVRDAAGVTVLLAGRCPCGKDLLVMTVLNCCRDAVICRKTSGILLT